MNPLLYDDSAAAELRDALVDELLADKKITSPAVERAFRTVPRHLFIAEGTPLIDVYDVDRSVPLKRDADGGVISSTSATYIQARMIEQAEARPGMNVLEIGSGGYNAALLAEIVGPDGHVVSVDIDPEVTDRASDLLDQTGYARQVTVMQADAQNPLPGFGTFDAILVTVGAWDIAPAWLEHLSANGRLVVPLRMNGITRSIGFRRENDHLVSTSAEVCGFVPIQGDGAHDEQIVQLTDPNGHHVQFRFDQDVPEDISQLDGVLATDHTELWSGVTNKHGVSFADLHLWFAAYLPGFCKLTADEGTHIAEPKRWFPFGVVRRDSFACLAVRSLPGGDGVEFGARAYGPHGEDAATAMVEQIQAWDRTDRDVEPMFAYWPNGTHCPEPGRDMAVLVKTHGRITITWPSSRPDPAGATLDGAETKDHQDA